MPQPISSPSAHSTEDLRPETVELARQLDAHVAQITDSEAFGSINVTVKRGIAKFVEITTHLRLLESVDVAKSIAALLANLRDEQAFATLIIQVKRGIPSDLDVTRSHRLDDEIVA